MPPLEAIRAATAEAATLLGVSDIGTLKAGNKADVVAVPCNPLEDISLMSEINLVIKDGQVYKQ